ncbi:MULTISPECIES: 16S rRNA (cytosine(967)-C(5))-methyltransferase RsmB [Bacillus cereus group]|uniref:16S rRNA (cytosine(967)-C(5))-methyltransferase n=1 Tax=Bacillus paramycoides TaxID=2026194 RepID=A0ABU6MU69_9BACI|nr:MULTISPECIES: 16S rRNA (cytosine(967)-C(5))-methyltransferase RsmB [Bacillus cereus group]MED0959454.1 16S rRNA (cytosine(967)-C(5))-methyltransferase RsmB [Bacillus paramycoides]MED0966126.1 16S rRNA (cytosine(967)-C(5))-methyltransferase RsmB [Bacillus paramycoides]MED0969392.1 16S rRNA (cytosine(967)-C(5))-methyltransferase RsmB [Bacillus paramycoides]MED0978826.1 16S rRNA (cytosine(967)-C(5))-methyltransferase RsmB [Bacillus paramycoides]MED0983507.1 16S rRNA (cytosine(967)-C(5))-methyl
MRQNVRELALDGLIQVEKSGAYSNLLLNNLIEKSTIDRKDIGLLTEIVYGTIQRRDTLDFYLQPFLRKKVEAWVRVLLRLSLYQMLYLDRVPERAAIHEAVEIAKRRGHKGISGMVNGVLRSIQREGVPSLEEIENPVERLAIATSHPMWLVQEWASEYGLETAEKMCEVNMLPPVPTARVNVDKVTVEEAVALLADEGIEAKRGELSEDAIQIERGNVAHTEAFKKGFLSIQDESSMLVARALEPNKGDAVLDSCAAPGGKTTHIAERLDGTGKVMSLDLHAHKVRLIEQQAKRLGLENVETMALDARKVQEHFANESFDKILVDAPCSGFGVIRRKPDIKLGKDKGDSERLSTIQLAILEKIAPLLKQGGRLVYSTCTIEKIENEQVIKQFLQEHPEFEWDTTIKERMPEKLNPYIDEGQVRILPHYFATDGFYIACLRKKV